MSGEREQGHVPVLLHEAIDGLNLAKASVFLDCTLGNAGHALEVFRRFGSRIRIIGIDADRARVEAAKRTFTEIGCRAEVFVENFRNLDYVLAKTGLKNVDGILFDLGLNSEQLAGSGKGFSFLSDEPLIMTFGEPKAGTLTAREIVNNYDESALVEILLTLGEERQAKNIARAIVEERKEKTILTAADLVRAIKRGYRGKYPRSIHFATRTFQALRIVVNDELAALMEGLEKGFSALRDGGRMVVISFHSMEDRIVKNFSRERAKAVRAIVLTKKPLVPSDIEVKENPRSRSAKLRILEKSSKNGSKSK